MSLQRTHATWYTLYGALFGLCFPVLATLIRVAQAGTFSLSAAALVQRGDPLLWIIDTAPFFLGLFARLAGLRQDRLAALVSSLDHQVQERTSALRSALTAQQAANRERAVILRYSDQGLVLLDGEGRMAEHHSALLLTWLGRYQRDTFFWDYLEAADPQASVMLRLGWEALQQDMLPRALVLEQMPRQVRVRERTLALHLRPIDEATEARGLILVVLSDISAEIERERLDVEQRELLEAMDRLLQNRQGFSDFFLDAERILAGLERAESLVEARRAVHTLKGNCGIYGLRAMARLCHEVEERMAEGGTLSAQDVRLLRGRWQGLRQRMGPLIDFAVSERIELSHEEYDALRETLARVPDEALRRRGLAQLAAIRQRPVRGKLEHLGGHARELAQRLGKGELQVSVDTDVERLPEADLGPLFGALIHVVRNAVDHGLEDGDRRVGAGKPRQGRLWLSARRRERGLTIEIRDDGKGIDWEALRRRARELGLPSETQEDLADALFQDGVSTRGEVTEISGRGVGLAAARAATQALGGAVEIRSEAGVGTRFQIHLPLA